jgi:hypothetical protein
LLPEYGIRREKIKRKMNKKTIKIKVICFDTSLLVSLINEYGHTVRQLQKSKNYNSLSEAATT